MAASRTRKLKAVANKHRGELSIEIGGRSRVLKFDMDALAALEDALKIDSFMQLFGMIPTPQITDPKTGKVIVPASTGNLGVKKLRAMIWAGLLHEQPDLKLTEMKIDQPILALATPVVNALVLALFGGGTAPADTEKKVDPPPTAANDSVSPPPTDSPAGSVAAIASSGG